MFTSCIKSEGILCGLHVVNKSVHVELLFCLVNILLFLMSLLLMPLLLLQLPFLI